MVTVEDLSSLIILKSFIVSILENNLEWRHDYAELLLFPLASRVPKRRVTWAQAQKLQASMRRGMLLRNRQDQYLMMDVLNPLELFFVVVLILAPGNTHTHK